MKSFILFTIAILFIGNAAFSINPVSQGEATTVARNFYFERINQYEKTLLQDITVKNITLNSKESQELYYAINFMDGYVLVSAQRNVYPVLAYAFNGSFDKPRQQSNVAAWLGQYERQISHAIQSTASPSHKTAMAWDKYLDENFANREIMKMRSVEPMLVSTWDQGLYYNGQCPADPSGTGGHCVTGCVATALGQLVYYFRFPESGTGSYSYEHPDYGTISANFAQANYDYKQMMNELNDPNPEVAELIFHLGVACDMVYGPQSSGMYNHKAAFALKTFFKYSPETQYVYRDSTSMNWDSLIIAHLDQKIPMYYAGWSVPNINGHAFILDGYQEDHFYHFNWGWGGSYDGYFYTEELTPGGNNFNLAQELVIHAFPDTVSYTYPDYCAGDQTFDFKGGTITDGSFPVYNYQNNANCQWLIDPQNEQDSVTNITLSFQRFALENDLDFVNIYDGENINAPLLGTFTGNTIPEALSSSGNKMLVTFSSNNQNTDAGFFASFESNLPSWCNGTTVMLEQEGEFSDGSHDFFYNNSSTCMWQIMPIGAESVTLYFNSFDTEPGQDHVKIYDTQTMELLADYSGYYPPDDPPPPVTSESGKIFFLFHSDEGGRAQGWEAVYYSNLVVVDEPLPETSFRIFPNPAKDEINISTNNLLDNLQKIELVNLAGIISAQWLLNKKPSKINTLDISGLSNGMYILKLYTSNGITATKIIIK